MDPNAIRFDLMFNAAAYCQSGSFPWTFFAYPTSLADEYGLPPDDDACSLLARLQDSGIEVAIWINGVSEDTTYFACRKDDIQRLHNLLQEFEDSGVIERGFCQQRTERLFAAAAKH